MTSPGVALEAQTADMLSHCLEAERNAKRRLSGQLESLAKGKAAPEASGRFETMLARYAINVDSTTKP